MERRLAAILAADVVGYSRLMEADEEAAARTLSRYLEISRRNQRPEDIATISHAGPPLRGRGQVPELRDPVLWPRQST